VPNREEKERQRIFLWQLIKSMEEDRDVDLLEQLAEFAHSTWAGWMHRMFTLSSHRADGVLIPPDLVKRWKRQMSTYYTRLPEEEKKSDRELASMYMDIFQDYHRKKRRRLEREQHEKDKGENNAQTR